MENGVWYILAALIMGWTGFCIYKWIKNRKRGGCGCGCTGCPHSWTAPVFSQIYAFCFGHNML